LLKEILQNLSKSILGGDEFFVLKKIKIKTSQKDRKKKEKTLANKF